MTRTLTALAAALVLAGCASVSPDGLRGDVQARAQAHLPEGARIGAQADAQARIAEWLAQPVDADTAVRIALLNNPGLQARLAQLAAQDAERARALTLFNPTLTLGRFTSGHERETERELGFSLVHIVTLPWRARWLGWRLEQATLDAAQDVLQLAAGTRRAWLRAVAARQVLATSERLHEAAEAGAELAQRMARAGNWSRLQQAREIATLQETAAQLARARLAAALAHEQLAQAMGLWGAQAAFALPGQLPALPVQASLQGGGDAEATALRERLDLRALRHELDTTAERNDWSDASAVFGDIGLSYSRDTATDRATGHRDTARGWEVTLPLPLFDWTGGTRAAARAEVRRSAAQLQQAAIRARGDARAGWLRYRTAWDLAHQQQAEVLPLARLMQDEAVLRYNGMFISTWDLLAEARRTAQAVIAATEAQRDFWLADADLRLALSANPSTPDTP